MFSRVIAGSISFAAVFGLSACAAGSANLRGADGALAPCSGAPHCMSSTSTEEDRRVAPFKYVGSLDAAQRAMAKIVSNMEGAQIVENTPGYMHAEFASPIFRYVDDVEFLFQEDRNIQVRSSSRIGYYDFGANRTRIEQIRKAFDAVQP